MTKLNKAKYYAEKQVENHAVYIWSGQGEKLRKVTAPKVAEMETSEDNAARVIKYIYNHLKLFNKNTRVFDCSGLICCILIYAGVLSRGSDYTAKELFNKWDAVNWGEVQPGDLVFKTDGHGVINHVGFVTTGNDVIEAKSRDYGIIRAPFSSKWELACRPIY